MLKRKCYNNTVDTWALGVILFELLVGVTPFHCFDMKELVRKINDGRYKLAVQGERIKTATCLFLSDCLQTIEANRIAVSDLADHPYISTELINFDLSDLNVEVFVRDSSGKEKYSEFTSSTGSCMLSRFDDTDVHE